MKDHRTELIEIQQETQAQSAASQSQGPGNQEHAESLGLDQGGALKGLEAVAEHDPALANELSGVAYLADTVLDEQHVPVALEKPFDCQVGECGQGGRAAVTGSE